MSSRLRNHLLRFAALIFFCAAPARGADADSADTIRVITYNVQFLPGIASAANKRANPEYRATHIAAEMSTYDIVALQETFEPRWRNLIVEELRRHWDGELNVVVSPDAEGRLTNGGCLILTRLPIVESNSVIYEHFSTPKEYGLRADGFAAKGVIHARIARSAEDVDNTIDVFVTHMEARSTAERELQYPELGAFIQKVSDPERPMLLLGDLNTRGNPEYRKDPESRYARLMKPLVEARAPARITDVWPELRGDDLGGTNKQESSSIGNRIDYIILSNPDQSSTRLTPQSIEVKLYQDPEVVALSDHNAVAAQFDWPALRAD